MTAINATVRTNREMVSLFGRFMAKSIRDVGWPINIAANETPSRRESQSVIRPSNRLSDQIVIGVTSYSDPCELAEGKLTTHVHAAIDIRSIVFAARDSVSPAKLTLARVSVPNQSVLPGIDPSFLQFLRARFPFHEHLQGTPHQQRRNRPNDFALDRHGRVSSPPLSAIRDLITHFGRPCARFW